MIRVRPFFLLLTILLAGCFSQRSFPMVPTRLAHLSPGERMSARQWTAAMHVAALDRLPADRRGALVTDQLAAGDGATNVWAHFKIQPGQLDSVMGNLHGIEESAQATSPPPVVKNGHVDRPAWVGFREVEVPVGDGTVLYARLGDPEKEIAFPDGADLAGHGSYIILTHGLFGSLDGFDIENHAQALRQMGHHVLALEMRGHGETYCRHPEYAITFGVLETGDLIAADRWLRKTQGAARVGLVCFSLTGYEALLTAWLDGKVPVTEFAGVPFLKNLPPHEARPAFDAGMFIVSAPVGIVGVADGFDRRCSSWEGPVKASFQERVAERLVALKDPPGFTMWDLAQAEIKRSGLAKTYPTFDAARAEFLKFIDFGANNWQVGAARMENVRVPLLVLSAANDPLGSAQNVAELFARQHNPNIGVVMLKEGGHMGFTALSADYYYSMMMNFFDPKTGPVAQ